MAEKILYIADNMSQHHYVPKMPNQSELDLIFDTGYETVQPYLFRVSLFSSFIKQQENGWLHVWLFFSPMLYLFMHSFIHPFVLLI